MNYIAKIKIDQGESEGFGLKVPCQYEKTISFEAINPVSAYVKAYLKTYEILKSTLSNPETNYSTGTILALTSENFEEINIENKLVELKINNNQHVFALFFGEGIYLNKKDLIAQLAQSDEEIKNMVLNDKATLEDALKT